jgi:hypothetical protein
MSHNKQIKNATNLTPSVPPCQGEESSSSPVKGRLGGVGFFVRKEN